MSGEKKEKKKEKELSQKEKIGIGIDRKESILKITNQIIENLPLLPDPKISLFMKKSINEVISDLSIIGGFCDKRERDYVDRISETAGILVNTLDSSLSPIAPPILEHWCTMVNSITVDFNKTPFRFVGGEFKLSLHKLEGKIKTILKR